MGTRGLVSINGRSLSGTWLGEKFVGMRAGAGAALTERMT